MLKLKSVSAVVDNTAVLNDIDLEIFPGEIHAIIGPKGSGKSSLAHLIQGNSYIEIQQGSITYYNKNINKIAAHKRSKLGIFTAFQYPPEIDGVSNLDLMRAIYEVRGNEFTKEVEDAYREMVLNIGLDARFPDEPLNTSTRDPSDLRKSEIIQLMMLDPSLIVLDEIDVDLPPELVTRLGDLLKGYLANTDKALIIITSNKPLLDQLEPNYVHVLVDGEIRHVGTTELLKRIDKDDYSQLP